MKDSILKPEGQQKVLDLMLKYKSALSLHGEVGNTQLEVDFDLSDTTPFYIRPFTVSFQEKAVIDKELEKLVKMGILEEQSSAYSSPIMLLKKKDTGTYRLVTDFRHLNQRIIRRNLPFPLIRDALQTIGNAQPTVLSVIDLKEAYHCLNLSPRCRSYCNITSYFGGKSYSYSRLPMGLNISPAIFQSHINNILNEINARPFCVGIMDDLIVFSKTEQEHFNHVESIMKALQRHGLKISPTKAKLFRRKVKYMGHEVIIKDGRPSIRALRDRTEAIRKLPIPNTKRMVNGFIGKVSYLSMYLPNLQSLLKPLHQVASKKADFVWSEDCQIAYSKIIELLVKPPILTMPRASGLFRLYCDTSKTGVGASLFQRQDGEDRLIGYFSKSLPAAAANYGITELELSGMYLAVTAFKYLLKGTSFEVFTDHASIPQILKSKAEPTSDRIKRLLEKLSGYSMKAYYQKGESMVICDFLSRNSLSDDNKDFEIAFPITTRETAKSQGIIVPTVQETIAQQTSKQSFKEGYQAPVHTAVPTPEITGSVPDTEQDNGHAIDTAQPIATPRADNGPIAQPPRQQEPRLPLPALRNPYIPPPQRDTNQPILQHQLVNPASIPAEVTLDNTASQLEIVESHTPTPHHLTDDIVPLNLNADLTMLKHLPKQETFSSLKENSKQGITQLPPALCKETNCQISGILPKLQGLVSFHI
jgi:hypothetical protein